MVLHVCYTNTEVKAFITELVLTVNSPGSNSGSIKRLYFIKGRKSNYYGKRFSVNFC
jgi:hypothetical protein